jgi:hypothetical protein
MGDDKKKGGSLLKKVVLTLILVPALSWVGYFAYAKATGQPNFCLFTVLCEKFK